jgi:mRNA-degrading endonuclease RelE of RelBE toxin-antitoxin system
VPPKYKVVAHRRVQKFLNSLKDENLKLTIISQLSKLEDYPLSLREMDTEKIKGLERTFRVRAGKYRIIFYVDNAEKKIYVTHAEARKNAYEKLG